MLQCCNCGSTRGQRRWASAFAAAHAQVRVRAQARVCPLMAWCGQPPLVMPLRGPSIDTFPATTLAALATRIASATVATTFARSTAPAAPSVSSERAARGGGGVLWLLVPAHRAPASWGPAGSRRWRGCTCRGDCATGRCACLGANRECDPDLCKVGFFGSCAMWARV